MRGLFAAAPIIILLSLAGAGDVNAQPARPLCNEYMRQLDRLMAAQPEHPRLYTVQVFRARASGLCRKGRRSEGQLYLQSAIRVMGAEPVGGAAFLDRKIKEREERRRELIDRRIIDP